MKEMDDVEIIVIFIFFMNIAIGEMQKFRLDYVNYFILGTRAAMARIMKIGPISATL